VKIATWNVNSIRTRLEHVSQWLQTNPVDVLCLQETKVVDADFPRAPLEALGYQVYCWGQKSYNGVAILSRQPLQPVKMGFAAVLPDEPQAQQFDEQKRVIAAELAPGLQVVNLYVPNGSAVGSEKYEYKLQWLSLLRQYLQTLLAAGQELVICGDFNIALEDKDIHDPAGREKQVMATDAERQALKAILELGLADGFRKFTAEPGHFSWWDYRAASFRRNHGWRIDHHYLSPKAYAKATACTIDTAPRKLEQPSDHTPVTLELDW
jgi:exodeoxyribonuclease III